jgi:hypothetical protein
MLAEDRWKAMMLYDDLDTNHCTSPPHHHRCHGGHDQSMGDRKPLGDRTKLLYIGGYSRSGSTLMLRVLGELPGFVAVGELFDIGDRSYRQNRLLRLWLRLPRVPFLARSGIQRWMKKMSRYERSLSTVLTAPNLVRYGYSLRSQSPRET